MVRAARVRNWPPAPSIPRARALALALAARRSQQQQLVHPPAPALLQGGGGLWGLGSAVASLWQLLWGPQGCCCHLLSRRLGCQAGKCMVGGCSWGWGLGGWGEEDTRLQLVWAPLASCAVPCVCGLCCEGQNHLAFLCTFPGGGPQAAVGWQ